jgi:4-amino-4-deoxy-L-arabinose transferase-like glycosyltransferase
VGQRTTAIEGNDWRYSVQLLCKQAGHFVALFLILLFLAVAGQWFTGVYHSDLSQWPDEGCHYVNGLLVHDYITDGFPGSPLNYALQYNVHYPRVTIGHWPPLYYVVQAAFYFMTGPSIRVALFLQAVFGAAVAAIVGWVISRFAGWTVALLASLATLAAPQIFVGMQRVMLDVPIALLTCLAMLAWARFLLNGTWPWSVAFGLAAVAAIMTKGNGIFLALVPPLSVALTGRLPLLWNWRFWLPAPIAAVTVPWYLLTYKISADGFTASWGGDYILTVLPGYSRLLLDQISAVGLLFAGLGAFRVLRHREWDWRHALGISAICLVAAGFAFTCVVPTGIPDERYLAPLVPALVILAYFGIEWIARSRLPRTPALVLALCPLAAIAVESGFPATTSRAMNAAADMIFAAPEDNPFILIGSTVAGEGAMTAEVAARDRSRQRYVVRGFSALGSGNFNGTDYRPRFATSGDLAQWIERHGIGWVVIDTSPSGLSWTHNAQLLEIARGGRENWNLAGRFSNSEGGRLAGETLVYKVLIADGESVDHTELLSVSPAKMIGR